MKHLAATIILVSLVAIAFLGTIALIKLGVWAASALSLTRIMLGIGIAIFLLVVAIDEIKS